MSKPKVIFIGTIGGIEKMKVQLAELIGREEFVSSFVIANESDEEEKFLQIKELRKGDIVLTKNRLDDLVKSVEDAGKGFQRNVGSYSRSVEGNRKSKRRGRGQWNNKKYHG